MATKVIVGIAEGCHQAGCALIGKQENNMMQLAVWECTANIYLNLLCDR